MKRKTAALLAAALISALLFPAAPGSAAGEADYGENPARYLYVSVSGSDETGGGTSLSPWKTPHRAVSAARPGDTILLGPGVYDILSPIELPPGVSLEGAGEATVLTSSALTEELGGRYAVLRLVSPPGEGGEKPAGSQHVSHIRFDGAGTATQAIEIQNRRDVAVHDCVIVNFVHTGVGWRATDMDDETPPAEYVTGGRFYRNYMKDNSFYGPDAWGAVYGRGALFCGGLRDFEISGNTIIEDCRTGAGGVRGVPVKFWYYAGWMAGCKISGNVIRRLGSPTFSTDESGWAFALESSCYAGMEICGNEFVGAVDLNSGRPGFPGDVSYDCAAWIHGNRFLPDPEPKQAYGSALYEETALILEQRTERVLIEGNLITGYNQALYFNIREGVSDFTFRSNRCVNMGGDAGSMFRVDGHGGGIRIDRFSVTDNLFEGSPSAGSGFGVIISQEMDGWIGQDITVAGNAVGNTLWNWLVLDGYASIDRLAVRDNIRFNTGGEYVLRSEENVSGYEYSGNREADAESWSALREAFLAD